MSAYPKQFQRKDPITGDVVTRTAEHAAGETQLRYEGFMPVAVENKPAQPAKAAAPKPAGTVKEN